jgi:hypothetical protein
MAAIHKIILALVLVQVTLAFTRDDRFEENDAAYDIRDFIKRGSK